MSPAHDIVISLYRGWSVSASHSQNDASNSWVHTHTHKAEIWKKSECVRVLTHESLAAITALISWGASVRLADLDPGISGHPSTQTTSHFHLNGLCCWAAIFNLYLRVSVRLRSWLQVGHSQTFLCVALNHSSVGLSVC